ncbi:deoxyhypusine synthase [Pycnococcus provasolii]
MSTVPSSSNSFLPTELQTAVLGGSESIPESTPIIKGYAFPPPPSSASSSSSSSVDYELLLDAMLTTGFQATHFAMACDEVTRMLTWRLSQEDLENTQEGLEMKEALRDTEFEDPATHNDVRTKIFLGCTSNLISSGVRESIRYLCQHKLIDVLVTTAGGIEEDLIKCMAPTYVGDFNLKGKELRPKGLNRIGNLLLPNDNYCKFEDWLMPILDAMLKEQREGGVVWTPSRMIRRLGKEINHEESIYYWCYKNDIPVYCPSITDGSIGDMLYFHTFKSGVEDDANLGGQTHIVLDIVRDIRSMNNESVTCKCWRRTGAIILGGGLPKHHICNANLMRNGADFAVFLNTAQEFDGSDSGAKPDEAVSWGKIKMEARPVKVHGEATLLFPLLVARTFAKIGRW